MNLTWIKLALWLRSSSIHNIPGAFPIRPMGMFIIAPWANDHDVAHLQPRQSQRTWFGVSRPPGCWVPASTWFQQPLSCQWACPLWPITMMLYIYRPRKFQWIWFGVHRPSGCRFVAAARFQEPLSHAWPWACPLCPHGKMTMSLHIYRPRQFQWAWFGVNRPSGCGFVTYAKFQEPLSHSLMLMGKPIMPSWANDHHVVFVQAKMVPQPWFGVNRPSGCWVLASARSSYKLLYRFQEPLLHPWACPCGQMSKWPLCSTSRAWDSSNELDLEWISPVFGELWAGQTNGRTDGDHSIVPLSSFGKARGQ